MPMAAGMDDNSIRDAVKAMRERVLAQPSQGWQCPCCRVVYAPAVSECRCAVGGPLSLDCTKCGMTGPCKDPSCRHPLAGASSRVVDPISGRDLGPSD